MQATRRRAAEYLAGRDRVMGDELFKFLGVSFMNYFKAILNCGYWFAFDARGWYLTDQGRKEAIDA